MEMMVSQILCGQLLQSFTLYDREILKLLLLLFLCKCKLYVLSL